MSSITLNPSRLAGRVSVEPSKSFAHRLLIAAALAEGESTVAPISENEDMVATRSALCTLGFADIAVDDDRKATVRGGWNQGAPGKPVDCGESGSTLRFLLPIAAARQGAAFTGRGRLLQRPLGPYARVFEQSGVAFAQDDDRVIVGDGLKSGRYALPGNVSSQFVTGMMLALPLLSGDSELLLETAPESVSYIEITLSALSQCGIKIIRQHERAYLIQGGQSYGPGERAVPGDWSHAAFFLAWGALGGPIAIEGLSMNDVQGDRTMLSIMRTMGAKAGWNNGTLEIERKAVTPIEMDARDVPDLVPAIAAVACGAHGISRIRGIGRLRLKESDRIEAIAQGLGALGAVIDTRSDELVIHGTGRLAGGTASAQGDHRIAMMLAVASVLCEGPVIVNGWESVRKSAPTFWEDYASLGGSLDG